MSLIFLLQRPRWRAVALPLGLLSGVLLAACSPATAPQPELIRPVKTVTVAAAGSSEQLSQTGEIRPYEETSLGFRIDGRILRRTVDVGTVVKAGDVIAELDPSDSQNQLKAAQAQLDSAVSAEKLALTNLNRIKQLLPGGAVSKAQSDQAQSSYDSAVSASKSAQANLAGARDRLSFTQLKADKAGVISVVSANQGQVVTAGQEVVRLASLQGKDAVFDVAERWLNHEHQQAGQKLRELPVTVSLLSDPTVRATGTVRDVSPLADPVTRTYRVRVSLQNPPAAFSFGTTVLGSVDVPDQGELMLPASALTRQGETAAVYLVEPGSSADSWQLKLQQVEVSRYTDQAVFLKAGLKGGERVVVAGVSKLRPQQAVKLLPEQK